MSRRSDSGYVDEEARPRENPSPVQHDKPLEPIVEGEDSESDTSTDSSSSDEDDIMAAAEPAVNLVKSQFQIPKYSGRVKGSVFQGETSQLTELYTIQEWCRRVNTVKSAAGWGDDKTADFAKLAIIQNEPAGIWLQVKQEADDPALNNWDNLSKEMIKEFRVWTSANDKVDILRSFVQKKGELSHQFLNRVRLGYQRFLEDLDDVIPIPNGETEPQKARRLEIVRAVSEYHLKSFFCLGLHDDLLAEITKSNVTTLEAMANSARTTEQALLQQRKRHTIAEVRQRDEPEGAVSAQDQAAIAAILRKFRPNNGNNNNTGAKKKNNNSAKKTGVKCYFCGIANHYANECNKRKADRAAGNYRAAIGDAPMTKAQFEATRDAMKGNKVNAVTSEEFTEEQLYEAFTGTTPSKN